MNWLKDVFNLAGLVLLLLAAWLACDIASKEVRGWHVEILTR